MINQLLFAILGGSEMLLILLVVVLLFGAKRIPKINGRVGVLV